MEGIKELEVICEKSSEENWVMKFLYRKISIYFTKLFLYLHISANAVTVLSGVVGLISIFFFTFNSYYFSIIGGLSLFIWFVLDCSDGQVARYNRTASIRGMYLDEMFGIVLTIVFAIISFNSYSYFGTVSYLLGFSIVIATSYNRMGVMWQDISKARRKVSVNFKKKYKTLAWFYNKFSFVFCAGSMVLFILAGSLFNILHLILLFYGFAFPLYAISIIVFNLTKGFAKK